MSMNVSLANITVDNASSIIGNFLILSLPTLIVCALSGLIVKYIEPKLIHIAMLIGGIIGFVLGLIILAALHL